MKEDKKFENVTKLKKGEKSYEKIIFGDIKKDAQILTSKTRKDGKIKFWLGFIRNGRLEKYLDIKKWMSKKEYEETIKHLAEQVGKPKII